MKNFITILFLCSFPFSSFAQTQFGIKGGFLLSDLVVNSDEIDDTNMKLGVTIGGFAKIQLFDWLVFQPEILYSTKGAKYKYDNSSVKANASYVDIPLIAVVQILRSPLNIHAGSQFSILSNAKYKYDSPLFGNDTVIDDNRSSYNNWDVAAAAGIGYFKDRLQVELRVTRGIRKIENDRNVLTEFIQAKDTKNLVFSFTLGFII